MNCKCGGQTSHDWGSEDCKIPTYRCDIDHCGHYFDDEKVVKTSDPYPHDQVFLCPECNNEDFTKMHSGFENGDKVVMFDGTDYVQGTYESGRWIGTWIRSDNVCHEAEDDDIYSATKSGYLKLIERLESQIEELRAARDMADEEIKKIEEEEKEK
jgi:hypothetical protein